MEKIIDLSIRNKLIVILFTLTIAGFGLYSVTKIPVGAVPDITNNQVQVITTSGNLSTQEIEQYITAPVEMEMANLPGVKEIRSVSKFGISLVTIVFDESMGTYLPRQLISEKIKAASANIPEGYGTPEMGPITTGLGEIYQYIVDVKPGYEKTYSAMELRTIQDWIIKRRLSGISGVVEINSWGGFLKQYEVAVNPQKIKSLGITLAQVYEALESNNSVSGGSYIEKTNQAYFIRGDGQVKSVDDIRNILVVNRNSVPILVRDVAEVRMGFANRFGAITANGKGETVLGQIMMLKNANSKEVIDEVTKRVAELQGNLPEGVFINPILERSELIGKTSFTVVENLILGALIVMLTVFLLLGNFRSALVIASVIPLALFFTISMMYVFGIDANLMSLGALDFGIIIDGAVIIVEFIALKIVSAQDQIKLKQGEERSAFMDQIAWEGASKMMKSAVFGQIIILIVFIPILSLSGVEGKMFRPMAIAFSFAIIGAMILGLTWVPVASALFLKSPKPGKRTIADWIMGIAYKSYLPVIKWSCNHKKAVLGAAMVSLVITGTLFWKMGGEFVPTLDEGDFVIQPVLKTGTSLSKTIQLTTQMENILIKEFPNEVNQIVSRIGAAEVPTDPMSMEEIDMIIKLHPRNQWVKASGKEELAERFKEALSVIPGIEYEFTQPIEMRFNELITGVRSDIAIKLFGEDLDYISHKANEIRDLVANIPGAGDVILEKTTGLPQIKVTYNRAQIAYYGVDIATLNRYLATAFGGQSSGVVFEGEKRFDMVMRFANENRVDIENINQLLVPVSNGTQVPLSVLAAIAYTEGPAKISRENTHRRVVVSVNVRNRDLQSVVKDIQAKIDANLKLAPGNYVEYGGQFENLQNASSRLLLAVPIALLLIFIFLHFAFGSLKDAVMIFTAIPLATVGGVLLLWVRDMPFSVSAGVGFIALFGIAVLNGIVLIEHLKELQKHGLPMREVILQGTRDRLRPVMLTAGAAAMGFLPMAISSGAGAEVQRPLATVVIGGLITSTMLTMIALPLFFEVFYNVIGVKVFPLRFIRSKTFILFIFFFVSGNCLIAQPQYISMDKAIELALKNNIELASNALEVEKTRALEKTAFDIDKTTISYGSDQNNVAPNGYPLKVWGVAQSFRFPIVYGLQHKTKKLETELSEIDLAVSKNKLVKEVAKAYMDIQLLNHKIVVLTQLDSLYLQLVQATIKRNNQGDASNLELLTIKAKKIQNEERLKTCGYDLAQAYQQLRFMLNIQTEIEVADSLVPMPEFAIATTNTPAMNRLGLMKDYSSSLKKLEKNSLWPDLSVNYFLGTNSHFDSKYYPGFEVGISVPLFFISHQARIKASQLAEQAVKFYSQSQHSRLLLRQDELKSERLKFYSVVVAFQSTLLPLNKEVIRVAEQSYKAGEVSLFQLINSFEMASEIQLDYFENVKRYNVCNFELQYFTY